MDQISELARVIDVNSKFADDALIPKAVRVSTRKPTPWEISIHEMKMMMSGKCSGIHPVFSKTYIRRVQVKPN